MAVQLWKAAEEVKEEAGDEEKVKAEGREEEEVKGKEEEEEVVVGILPLQECRGGQCEPPRCPRVHRGTRPPDTPSAAPAATCSSCCPSKGWRWFR